MEFGPEIKVDGVKPDWYRGEHLDWMRREGFCRLSGKSYLGYGTPCSGSWDAHQWSFIEAIRLPSDHPYYLATNQGMTYFAGGAAPDDYDGGEVLTRGGWFSRPGASAQWARGRPANLEIIGYRKKPKPSKIYIAKNVSVSTVDMGLADFADLGWTEIGAIGGMREIPERDIYDEDECDYDCDCADHKEARASRRVYTVTHEVGKFKRTISGPNLAHILECLDNRND